MNKFGVLYVLATFCILNVYAYKCNVDISGHLYNNTLDLSTKLLNCSSMNIKEMDVKNIKKVALLTFDLSSNSIFSTEYLNSANLDNLNNLHLHTNKLRAITRNFPCIKTLKIINLNYNNIDFILDGVLACSHNLRELHLRNNSLTYISQYMVGNLEKLIFLDFSNNYISKIHIKAFYYLVSLENLNLRNNELSNISNIFKKVIKLKILYIDYNNVSLKDSPFEELINLRRLYLGNNNLISIDKINLKGLENLKLLNLNKNYIEIIKNDTFVNLKEIREIDLGNNFIENMSCSYFSKLMKLITLKLNNNIIKQFNHSNNKCSSLQNLNINSNNLSTMNFILSNFPGLKYINISHNNISNLNKDNILRFNDVKELDLSNNPLNCECEFKMKSDENIFKHMDFSEEKCYFNRYNVHPLPTCPITNCKIYKKKSLFCNKNYYLEFAKKNVVIISLSLVIIFFMMIVVYNRLSVKKESKANDTIDTKYNNTIKNDDFSWKKEQQNLTDENDANELTLANLLVCTNDGMHDMYI